MLTFIALLNLGGLYGGAAIIKSRLLPWLGPGSIPDTSTAMILEAARRDRHISDMHSVYEKSMIDLENDLSDSRIQADDLKAAYVPQYRHYLLVNFYLTSFNCNYYLSTSF